MKLKGSDLVEKIVTGIVKRLFMLSRNVDLDDPKLQLKQIDLEDGR